MGEKSGMEILLDHLPSLNKWYNVIVLYAVQLLIFIAVIAFFWWISSKIYYGAILGQIIVSTLLVFHFIYIANKSKKIKDEYRKKYENLAGQYFWYYYQSYTIPVISAAFYFSLLLYNGYPYLPAFIPQQSHFITNPLIPFYIALPLGIIIIIFGWLMKRPSGGYGKDVDDYLYIIYPEKGKLITKGMYKYIRNPQYLARGIISIGFGVVANNISAMVVGFIHFISYCAIIPSEDKEMLRRFGKEFEDYKKRVPALFPKFFHWKDFIKYIFIHKNN